MASDIWLRTILIVRKEACCRHIGYSFRLTARVLLYAPSHRHTTAFVTPVVEHWLEQEIKLKRMHIFHLTSNSQFVNCGRGVGKHLFAQLLQQQKVFNILLNHLKADDFFVLREIN